LLGRITARGAVTLRALSDVVASRKELQARLSQQQAVARIGQLALTDVSLSHLLDEACRIVAAELPSDFASVLELLPDRTAFVQRAAIGWPAEMLGVGRISAGPRSHGGYTLDSDQPVIMREASDETRFDVSDCMRSQDITSGLTARIGSFGVLGAHTRRRRDFSNHDVTFLEAVASVIATSLARKVAEEEAETAYRVLQAVIEGTTDDVFVKDVDGRFITLNATAARTLGHPRDEVVGRLLHEVMPPQLADMMAETDRLILERGRVETFEEVVAIDGEPHVLLTTKGPYRARDGTLLGTFGIARDITARKAQEQEATQSEERFRLAQEGARMGTWDLDVATGVTMWSDGLRTLYGVGADYPTGFEAFEPLLHPDDRERVNREVAGAEDRADDFEFECRIIRPDGQLRWLLARSSVRLVDGAIARQLGVVIDITARKGTEDELARSEETLRLAQSAAGLGAWDMNITSLELTCDPGVYEIFGLDFASDELTYETFADFIHVDDRDAIQAEIRRVFRSGESYYECPCRIVQPSGEIRWVVTRGTVVRSEDGTPQRMLGVTLDETERKGIEIDRVQLEIRLRQAEKLEALGQLAGGVAHDFNNLLVAIRGYGELALGLLERGEDGVASHVEGVLAAADRAAGLTKQLLAFGRRQVLLPEVLDLNDVVRETSDLLQRVIGDNVVIMTTLTEQPVVVRADRGQLEQVITNLAVNARDAMTGGGVVTIRVATADLEHNDADARRHAVLSVKDEGSGIDATTAALIFEPFFTTKGEQGTGLGLATVYGIVAQSGGHLVLDTEPGFGSTFSVYLPLSADELPVAENAPPPKRAEGTERILLVDDDPAVLTIVSSMLATRGYEIIGAADGDDAIARFEERDRPIELVISDLIMHGLDGRETTERIRAIEPATKVLYMSGYTDDATIRSGALAAGTAFIQKPFSGDDLANRVRELLDHVVA
jgi:two-component system cell cycle sensor histidine kinase/response regulator CckA